VQLGVRFRALPRPRETESRNRLVALEVPEPSKPCWQVSHHHLFLSLSLMTTQPPSAINPCSEASPLK
jgi:hypothetical protein